MTAPRPTPAQSLANTITARLVREGLLAEDRSARFASSLAGGKLKSSDWRLVVGITPPVKPEPTQR